MTARETQSILDKVALYTVNEMTFRVIITDVRVGAFQRIDVQIMPDSGSGTKWVALTSVKVLDEKAEY